VVTVADIDATCRFYCDVLGFTEIIFGAGRIALRFGSPKINLTRIIHEGFGVQNKSG